MEESVKLVESVTNEEIEKQYFDNLENGIYKCIGHCEKDFNSEDALILHGLCINIKVWIEIGLFFLCLPIYAPFRVGKYIWNNRNKNKKSTLRTILVILSLPVTLPLLALSKLFIKDKVK
jgi:hypothetical protein